MIDYQVRPDEAGLRLDRFLCARLPHMGGAGAARLIAAGEVRVDGRRGAKKGLRLRAGQRVSLPAAAAQVGPTPQPEIPLEIIAERADLVAINKAAGLPCHPLRPAERGTVANGIAARFPDCVGASPDPREAGLVHRLDRSTSGVLLAARDPETYSRLRQQFGDGRVTKEYLAVATGALAEGAEVTASVKPVPGDRTRVAAVEEYLPDPAHEARSVVEPLEQLGGHTLVRVQSATGRRHQVRVHLAHLGHPLAGDTLYGGAPLDLPGRENAGALLHASKVALPDDEGSFEVPAPWDDLLAALRARAR